MSGTNRKWYQLDNAAKIIPSTAQGPNTRVFRISCQLKENIDEEILQDALDEVIEEFPYFNCVLRRGFFWYYLDYRKNLAPKVEKESLPPCSRLYFPGRKNILYRILYYEKRISLEMFHVLADGTGAFIFFKKLISTYISKKYNIEIEKDDENSSVNAKGDDAFKHFYEKNKGLKQLKSLSSKKAYHIKGEKDLDLLPHLVEGCISSSKFLDIAHSYNTSVGVLATAVYIVSVIDEMTVKDFDKNIVVSVPVNLRQFFPSETTRNFYGTITVYYNPKEYDGDLKKVIEMVDKSFKSQLSKENIKNTMNSYAALEHNIAIRVVPLFIKDLTIGFINKAAKSGVTTTMSNLGNIKMPENVSEYIDRFSAFMTAPSQQICVASFGDKLVFGEVSAYATHDIMLHFFRRLVSMGLDVEITSSDYDEDEEIAAKYFEDKEE